ncbi:hypothetical protein JL722_6805 [Aureococcus anophagefferens]|nr:hypothetical protein JL722_6805 [Aureococcus anophagefferens]
MGTLPRHAVAALVLVAPLCAASFWSKKKAAEAPVVPAVRIADCRYEKLAYREGGSRVECFRWGERARLCGVRIVARPETRPRPAAQVDEMAPEQCHAGPPFWGWWNEFRNCAVTNACLLRNVLTLYSGDRDPPAYPSPLACNNWGKFPYEIRSVRGLPPPPTAPGVLWYVHASRILPGHFGHDMLNNYLYVFNTIWELNLTHWMDWGKLRHVVDDAVRSKLGEQLVETMQYSRAEQPVGYNVTQCYGLSLRGAARDSSRARRGRASDLAGSAASTLGAATTHGAELIFRRSSPSRLKKQFWRDYRDMFARKFCAGCDHRQATRPLRGRCPAKKLNVVLTRRTHDPASSRVMFANGRGRRILNNDALAKALGAFGRVRNVDPGRMPLGDQIRLMMSADVLVSRMSSQVIAAMFLKPGAICIEVEAPDPARLDSAPKSSPGVPTNSKPLALGACVMGQKMSVKAGDTIPSVVLCDGMQFPPKLVNVADEIKGKKVLIMGLPGAFTPC